MVTPRPVDLQGAGKPDRPSPLSGDHSTLDDDDRWREAARLRRDHPRWVVIWLAPTRQFRAYGRIPGARRDTALTAITADELATQICQAEQARQAARRSMDRT